MRFSARRSTGRRPQPSRSPRPSPSTPTSNHEKDQTRHVRPHRHRDSRGRRLRFSVPPHGRGRRGGDADLQDVQRAVLADPQVHRPAAHPRARHAGHRQRGARRGQDAPVRDGVLVPLDVRGLAVRLLDGGDPAAALRREGRGRGRGRGEQYPAVSGREDSAGLRRAHRARAVLHGRHRHRRRQRDVGEARRGRVRRHRDADDQAGGDTGPSDLHHDDDLRNDRVWKDRRHGGDDGEGHRHGLGAHDRVPRAALRARRRDRGEESDPVSLEHDAGLPDGAVHRVLVGGHPGHARLLREERRLGGGARLRRSPLRQRPHGGQRDQDDRLDACGGDHLRSRHQFRPGGALHRDVRDCGGRRAGGDVRGADGVCRLP